MPPELVGSGKRKARSLIREPADEVGPEDKYGRIRVIQDSVPLLAGMTDDGSAVIIDYSVPEEIVLPTSGVTIQVIPLLLEHELVEYVCMTLGKLDYATAHRIALAAEHNMLMETYDVDEQAVEEYETILGPIEKAAKAKGGKMPAHIYLGPYRHGSDKKHS